MPILISLLFLSAVTDLSMKDAPYTPDEESTYECFDCGTVVHATTGTTCPDCGSDMRNRGTPIE
ncbi:hypothetical protein Htur_2812 [Haloterrigena turkmenica DSM 5511]|uniref:DUF7129 domain-containing protein n=1 Tax=Haloterrigena turkmenica (strain ATCC 51198 / DSM 5511 / JCM 9101 / NCIMB 13204 / VKM B-1734 / 4k) TaxID=543526 RepID=D2RXG0_HALTV|nr:hypothetical protein Htur_2812 [Haloterrigena turkmenica DSM 5511]